MESPFVGLTAIALLVLANGFFVATEFAIVAVRRSRLEQLLVEGHPTAAAAKQVVSHLDTYIAACQLGITMASLALGWLGEPALAHLIEPPLTGLFQQLAPTAAHGIAVGISFAIITALHIVIGELAPKGLALQRPEGTALWVARPMQIFELIFRWPITVLNGIGNGVLRLGGLQPASGHEMVHSVDELRLIVTGSREAGVMEVEEAEIASRAFEFGELTAGALMTPRTEIEAVPLTIGRAELLTRAADATHSRLVVFNQTLDDIVGVIHLRDLFKLALQPEGDFKIHGLVRPMHVVPKSKHAHHLLNELRAARLQVAVVVDEFGGTAGIVTLSNLVEALVGRFDEESPIGTDSAAANVNGLDDTERLLDGLTRLDELEEITGLQINEEEFEDVETLGGLIMARLGRIPELGDEVVLGHTTLRVAELDGRRVAKVHLSSAATSAISSDD